MMTIIMMKRLEVVTWKPVAVVQQCQAVELVYRQQQQQRQWHLRPTTACWMQLQGSPLHLWSVALAAGLPVQGPP